MQRLEQPFKLYTDAAGKPLDGGYIYFGQVFQSPETSPVTVYWDESGTIPAAQPLRTVGGYIVNNGAPANVYLNGVYSELVKDKNGVQLFYAGSINTNPAGFVSTVSGAQVVSGLGYTPASTVGPQFTNGIEVNIPYNDMGSAPQNTLTVRTALGNDSAVMQFERVSAYGIKFGLNGSNAVGLGGWSQGSAVYRFISDVSGNFSALGNVTAYSDMRRKTDIVPLTLTTQRLLQMRGFTYLDTVTGQRKIGVGAQEALQAGFHEAVTMDDDGHLSVAYGQLALAALVEHAREMDVRVKALEAQLKQLKEV